MQDVVKVLALHSEDLCISHLSRCLLKPSKTWPFNFTCLWGSTFQNRLQTHGFLLSRIEPITFWEAQVSEALHSEAQPTTMCTPPPTQTPPPPPPLSAVWWLSQAKGCSRHKCMASPSLLRSTQLAQSMNMKSWCLPTKCHAKYYIGFENILSQEG